MKKKEHFRRPKTSLLLCSPSLCLQLAMEEHIVFDGALTRADQIVLRQLARDVEAPTSLRMPHVCGEHLERDSGIGSEVSSNHENEAIDGCCGSESTTVDEDVVRLKAMRDPTRAEFEPTVLLSIDDCAARVHPALDEYVLQPYVRWAGKVARHETDVAMITHLFLYFATSVPSAIILYRHFTYIHGVAHAALQFYYLGTYTLMMHQHIHQRGILAKRFSLFDQLFPYILDPMMGHTWNTYYYHHVKHHHVEGNGPDDLSSTLRYQRDSVPDFLHYVGRFFFLVWLDLPLYFLRKNRPALAVRTGASELLSYFFYYAMARCFGTKATIFVYLVPLLLLRMGLMVGNWGQHAFVDADEPDSDFRSSITVIDVAVSICKRLRLDNKS